MAETRAGKLGRFEAQLILYTLKLVPQDQRRNYILKFLEEVKGYSDKPRKRGEPRNEGCVRELEELDNLNIYLPEQLARLVKERFHLMYQKQTSRKSRDAFVEEIYRSLT